MDIKQIIKGLGLAALVATTLETSGCGSCSNFTNDLSRDFVKRDYELILFSANGDTISIDTLRNTFVNVGENGSGLRYLRNEKNVMINGTYILKEI